MTTFLATELTWEGEKSVYFDAEGWTEAESYCEKNNLTLDGIWKGTIFDEDLAKSMIFDLEAQKRQNNNLFQ